ncbi:MAG: hypothetical protein AAF958_10200 [Planctomycetota bacterium]
MRKFIALLFIATATTIASADQANDGSLFSDLQRKPAVAPKADASVAKTVVKEPSKAEKLAATLAADDAMSIADAAKTIETDARRAPFESDDMIKRIDRLVGRIDASMAGQQGDLVDLIKMRNRVLRIRDAVVKHIAKNGDEPAQLFDETKNGQQRLIVQLPQQMPLNGSVSLPPSTPPASLPPGGGFAGGSGFAGGGPVGAGGFAGSSGAAAAGGGAFGIGSFGGFAAVGASIAVGVTANDDDDDGDDVASPFMP